MVPMLNPSDSTMACRLGRPRPAAWTLDNRQRIERPISWRRNGATVRHAESRRRPRECAALPPESSSRQPGPVPAQLCRSKGSGRDARRGV